MVGKTDRNEAKRSRIKLGRLTVNRETLRDLTGDASKGSLGGARAQMVATTGTVSIASPLCSWRPNCNDVAVH